AASVMLGSLLAGHEEAPGELFSLEGKRFKAYNGMGSLSSMEKGSGDRYSQDGKKKFVPEGVEGYTPYKGEVENTVYQLIGGLRSGLGYFGANDIDYLRKNGEFIVITPSGLKESHVHGIIAKDAPNYKA
ncbi:MAG: IMP dehydrogenase, partial [Defluviitaleaceae bacterium]|nr:IMP dehydrogenase [Defluviitaleaceae bacterium]